MTPVPVAQYLRMSKELQQYSIQNQADAIARYAAEHNYEVVRTYSDAAKSGVTIDKREGLKQLLKDVVEGGCQFRAILVYDVSRWGRFQDADEAAHYEYLCKSSGVPVYYCAETFADDYGVPTSIMKALRRTMAGEYSRELSVKTRSGQMRLVNLGYKMGGGDRYALRRLLLDTTGKPKQLLAPGEQKSIVNEHVVFVPGSPKEIVVVQRIFQEFADEKRDLRAIARGLNRDGLRYVGGVKWNGPSVKRVLKQPLYIGTLVWGKTAAQVLAGKRKKVAADQWAIRPGACTPIIDKDLFERAEATFASFPRNLTDDQLLDKLRAVLKERGKLSSKIIGKSRLCPSEVTYLRRFGSLMEIYRRLDYTPANCGRLIPAELRYVILRRQLIDEIQRIFPAVFEEVRKSRGHWCRLKYKKTGLLVSLAIASCCRRKRGDLYWKLRVSPRHRQELTMVALLDDENTAVYKLFLVPKLIVGEDRFSEHDQWLCNGLLVNGVEDFLSALLCLRSRRSHSGCK